MASHLSGHKRRKTDVMTLHPHEVDVPIHHTHDRDRHGPLLFAGLADSPMSLSAAHAACDQAVQRVSADRPVADHFGSE